jgi:hypothetical protein
MLRPIKPSDVVKRLVGTVWRKREREIVATNILKLARFHHNDEWKGFTWDDYVGFCSHQPTKQEKDILQEFVREGYLSKDGEKYVFTNKIIGVYMQYT